MKILDKRRFEQWISMNYIPRKSLSCREAICLIQSFAVLNFQPQIPGVKMGENYTEKARRCGKDGLVLSMLDYFCRDSKAVHQGLLKDEAGLSSVSQISLFWAAAVFDDVKSALRLLPTLVDVGTKHPTSCNITQSEKRALYAALLWLGKQERRFPENRLCGSAEENITKMIKSFIAQNTPVPIKPVISAMHTEVKDLLQEILGAEDKGKRQETESFDIFEEYQHPDILWTKIDLAIPARKLAVEINGPAHYLLEIDVPEGGEECSQSDATVSGSLEGAAGSSSSYITTWGALRSMAYNKDKGESSLSSPSDDALSNRLVTLNSGTGSAVFRTRSLEDFGWTVVDMSFLEWRELKTQDEKRDLLLKKLRAAAMR
ncbi:unnamed protein product [Amoebophrya sp. A25]|nr:unnamed protein product [Amoebophrya sp. A25]|eukprot:GSA25T00003196001.1